MPNAGKPGIEKRRNKKGERIEGKRELERQRERKRREEKESVQGQSINFLPICSTQKRGSIGIYSICSRSLDVVVGIIRYIQ